PQAYFGKASLSVPYTDAVHYYRVQAMLREVRPIYCSRALVTSCRGFSSGNSLRSRIPPRAKRTRTGYKRCPRHDTCPRGLRTSLKQRRKAFRQRRSENNVFRPNNVENSFDCITFSLDRRNEPISSDIVQFLADSGHIHGQCIVVDETFVLPEPTHDFISAYDMAFILQQKLHDDEFVLCQFNRLIAGNELPIT